MKAFAIPDGQHERLERKFWHCHRNMDHWRFQPNWHKGKTLKRWNKWRRATRKMMDRVFRRRAWLARQAEGGRA